MPRFMGATLTSVLFLSGVAPASAACVLQTDRYLYRYFCDVYTEADLRQVNTLVPSYPFPDVVVRLGANVTVNGSIDFGNVNSLAVDTNGFTLTGDTLGTRPNRFVKTGSGSMRLTARVSIRPAEGRTIQVSQGTLSIGADVLQPTSWLPSAIWLSDAGAMLQAGAPVTVQWNLALAKGIGAGKPWYNPGDAEARYDETIDTNGFSVTSTGTISGSGRLVKSGAGTLTLTGENYSLGGVLIADGTLRVSSDRSLGVLATDRLPFCEISFYDGPSCTTLPPMTAPLALDGGTLEAGGTFTVGRPIAIGTRGGTFDTHGFTLTLSNSLDGAGGLNKGGAGTLVLAGHGSYGGATNINAGTLRLAGENALPAGTAMLIAESATLDMAGQAASPGSLAGAGSVWLGAGALTVGSNNASTLFSGSIDGTGSVRKVGIGTLQLTGTAGYSGGTFVDAGTLVGTTRSLQGPIANNSILGFVQGDAGAFLSTIAGRGGVFKTGAGTVTFTQPQTYTGLTEVGAGELHIAGLGGAALVDAGAMLSGTGTIAGSLAVSGTLRPGTTTESAATSMARAASEPAALTIVGNLLLTNTATLQVPFSQPHLLRVNGRATIDNAQIVIIDAPAALPRVSTVPMFTATGGTVGSFGRVTSAVPLDPILTSRGTTTYVTLIRTDILLASLADSSNTRAVGGVLDAVRAHATGDLQIVVREVSALPDTNVADALTKLAATPYATRARLAALDGQRATHVVADRLADVRDLNHTEEAPHALASTSPRATAPSSAVWFRSNDQNSALDGSSIDGRLDGGLLGFDHRFESGWLAGAFGGFDRGQVQADDGSSTLTDRRYRGGAYVSHSGERAYVDGALAFARHAYEASRHVAFAAQLDAAFGGGPLLDGVNRTAASSVHGWETSALVEAGLRRAIATMRVQPFVTLDWTRVGQDAFTEAGADAVDLSVAPAATQSVRAGLGVRLSHPVGSTRSWTPRGELRYARELADVATRFTAAFVDAPAAPFTIQSATLGRDAAIGSVGILGAVGSRLVLSADYRAAFETNYHSHAVVLGVAF